MTEIQKLEIQLAKAKAKESDEKWINLTKEISEFMGKLSKYDFYINSFQSHSNVIVLNRLVESDLNNYYLDGQGAYGQWTKKRFLVFYSKTFTIGSQYLSSPIYSTGKEANMLHTDKYQINTPVTYLTEGKGFPLGPKESWSKQYKRYLDTGTISLHNSSFKFGDENINVEEGWVNLLTSFNNFKRGLGIVTDKSIFDSLEKLYINQCQESMDVMSDIKTNKMDSFIPIKDFKW